MPLRSLFRNLAGRGRVHRDDDTSAANTVLTVTTPTGATRKLLFVAVKYSAAPTQTGVTVALLSGLGAAYNALLFTAAPNLLDSIYLPDGDLVIADSDAFVITAPAGGAGITSSISIYTEAL